MSFRSSDIEFWAIDAVDDVAEIVSAKYGIPGNVSLEIELPNAFEQSSVNTNSIVLVDCAFLSEPQYISRDTYRQMQSGEYDWETGTITVADRPFLEALSWVMGTPFDFEIQLIVETAAH